MAHTGESKVYNRKDVARLLNCSPGTVDNLVRRRVLTYTRRWSGGPRCWTDSHIEAYLRWLNEEQTRGGERSRAK